MNKKIFSLALAALGSMAMAATAVVWDRDAKPDMAPAYSFTFTYGTGAGIDTTNVDGVKVIDFTAKAGTASNGAGYGFGWKQNPDTWKDVPISLASYKGVCLTYKAEQPFRVDFKQSNITDDNYYGAEIAAAASYKKTFIAFADLAQGWNGTKVVAWSAASQLGVQFGYKNTHAKASSTNTVELASFILADECVTYAPELLEPYKSKPKGDYTLNEGDTLKFDLSEIFGDEDGDPIQVSVTGISGLDIVEADAKDSYAGTDIVKLVTSRNPSKGGEVVFSVDGFEDVAYTANITVVDGEVPPVAVADAYKMKEDEVLEVLLDESVIMNDYDLDEDEGTYNFIASLVTDVTNGTLVFNDDGTFTYTPNKDFYGEDSFTYKLTETTEGKPAGYEPKESQPAKVTITITGVDDPANLEIAENATIHVAGKEQPYTETIEVEEDFKKFEIKLAKKDFAFSDPDELKGLTPAVKSKNEIVAVKLASIGDYYVVTVTAVENANGEDVISLYYVDGKDTISVDIAIEVAPVDDPPVAVADAFVVIQDSLNSVTAKQGLLANDVNPDDPTAALVAVLDDAPANGELTLNEDGSFTYKTNDADFAGEDTFTYHVKNEAGVESEVATVTLTVKAKNQAPTVVASAVKTASSKLAGLQEDFTTAKTIAKNDVIAMFTDDYDEPANLKYSVKSVDGKLSVKLASGAITVSAVADSCGSAEIIVTAKDSEGLATDATVTAKIGCVNDKPVVLKDTLTIKIGAGSEWSVQVDLDTLVFDVDGDELKYEITTVPTTVSASIEGSILTVSSKAKISMEDGTQFYIAIKASDEAASVKTGVMIKVREGAETAIAHAVAAPKSTWQNAILATRGTVAVIDMQGRVMWQKTLPASEAEVRAATQKVGGNAIVRVNKQTWLQNTQVAK